MIITIIIYYRYVLIKVALSRKRTGDTVQSRSLNRVEEDNFETLLMNKCK